MLLTAGWSIEIMEQMGEYQTYNSWMCALPPTKILNSISNTHLHIWPEGAVTLVDILFSELSLNYILNQGAEWMPTYLRITNAMSSQ